MTQRSLSVLLRLLVAIAGAALIWVSVLLIRYGRLLCEQRGQEQLFLPGLIVLVLMALAVAAALILAWRIFASIGQDRSFSHENARRLKFISGLACGDTVACLLALPILRLVTEVSPFTMLALLVLAFGGLCLTVVSASLSHLVQKAADLKQEQELTI